MKRRLALAGAVAALAATALLLGGVFSDESPSAQPPAASGAAPADISDRAFAGFALGDTARTVASLQASLRKDRKNADLYVQLGLALQQLVRETGDASLYTRSEGALRRALALAPKNVAATSGLGSLSLARHRFGEALVLGRRAQRRAPWTAHNYGIVGDALIELGRYEQAFRAFDRMAGLKPNVASYSRVSYARELLGDGRGAISAMRLALDAAGSQPEPSAWTHVQLGKLLFSLGRVRPAGAEYRAALAVFPGYVYALEALAHVEAAEGRPGRAIALTRDAVERVPLPQFVATLGDLLAASGRKAQAREQYAVMGAIERLLIANGVRTDLETALFNVDHGIRLPQALRLARRAHAERPSIEADGVLAWALLRNNRCGEALGYSKRALRLGTLDAPKFLHRAMIERCLGRPAEARRWARRALALNPSFSLLWAPAARRIAA